MTVSSITRFFCECCQDGDFVAASTLDVCSNGDVGTSTFYAYTNPNSCLGTLELNSKSIVLNFFFFFLLPLEIVDESFQRVADINSRTESFSRGV